MSKKFSVWMLATLLLLSASAGYGVREAAAAEPYTAHYAYTDPRTGEVFFNVIRDVKPYRQHVVFRAADGQWMRLPDDVTQIWSDGSTGCARVGDFLLQPAPFHDACYDAAADELVYTSMFTPSPSGKWGLKIITFFEPTSQPNAIGKKVVVMLKNNATGAIRQILESSHHPSYTWLPDGTLALERFSETERQNEIVRINPATGETKRLMLGSLRADATKDGLLLYVKNEPSRPFRIYDYRTGKSRLAKEGEAEALFFADSGPRDGGEPSMPANLDLDALPIAETGIRQEDAAALKLDNGEVPLPFAFIGLDGETYVPLKPLLDRGWTLAKEAVPEGGHAFVVRSGRGEVRLHRGNSTTLEDRLYVPIRLLQTLGHEAELKWNR
jgi:hypothetical protein